MAVRRILVVGGSTRAAADSVRRAGWQPICADLFADLDLRHTAEVIPVRNYPESLPEDIAHVRADGWFYCGALENHPQILDRILANGSRCGPLLGSDPAALRCVRDPLWLEQTLIESGLPALKIALEQTPPVADATWIQKPIASAGGIGVRIWNDAAVTTPLNERHYFQTRIVGVGLSALFRVESGRVECLGFCGELEDRTASRPPSPFSYCGSYGPLPEQSRSNGMVEQANRIARILAAKCPGLRGLVGLDFQWKDDIIWLTEVNPRFTASVEVLELATGHSFLNKDLPQHARTNLPASRGPGSSLIMKQILYANYPLTIPDLHSYLPRDDDPWALPLMADIPIPNSTIKPQWPICTVLGFGDTKTAAESCLNDRVASVRSLLDGVIQSTRAY